MKPNPVFDYHKNGIVFINDGTIFYSPNSSRIVKIPPSGINEPFKQPRLNVDMFKQPVWWSMPWGWQSFIPLSPSFTSSPFEIFCWMPHVEEVTVVRNMPSRESQMEKRYQMSQEDISAWKYRENLITNAAKILQLQFKISCNNPPLPSSFNYDKPHKSFNVAKRMICVSRDWFIIWMGFLSFIISQTKIQHPNSVAVISPSPLPFWYEYLRDAHQYSDSWLDGLSSSTVCTVDIKTPRAGIIFQWTNQDSTRPPIDFFLENHVPMYFMWTSSEERAISVDSSLAYLQPPTDLVQEALTILFRTPNLPLAGLVTQQYFGLGSKPITNETLQFLRLEHATSFVFDFVTEKFTCQTSSLEKVTAGASSALKTLAASRERQLLEAAESAVAFPVQGMLNRTPYLVNREASLPQSMLDLEEDTGKLYDSFELFFTARAERQAELIKLESKKDRQRRLSREKQPGVTNSTLYTWKKTCSSGGREVYMRVRVEKIRNDDVYSEYRPSERCFNAFSNEWDLCHDFNFGSDDGYVTDSDGDEYDNNYQHDIVEQSYTVPHSLPESYPMETDTDETDTDDSPMPIYSRDVLETAKLVYGYVTPLEQVQTTPTKFTWRALLGFLGFVNNLSDLSVSDLDEQGLLFFFETLSKGSGIPRQLLDLSNGSLSSSSGLFDFSTIRRPSQDLFVFYSPRSSASRWVLGVHSSTAALYVCRYILTNPAAHTLLTVAHRLVERGIPFRTLLPIECSPRQVSVSQEFSPKSHRLLLHTFTVDDFKASMLQCQTVLSSPQGRAALLHGGIIGRIAKDFISNDRVFEGPSVEVTAHQVGYLVPSEDGIRLCDDELTEHEIAIICGSYSLYSRT